MKTHIFIATTQGLVAIQNITPIDDEDVSSVVSVNGTSTTANISGSYHNFVKKGVGIIHQMFGACSYRVDISARIDQGNSWQVAMYLAHLAQSKGLLGNGEVSQGDTVICATGEINTSTHQVLAVSEVPLKLKLAETQLNQWTELGAEVKFLLPLANQSDIQQSVYCLLISHLEQAADTLPKTAQDKPAYNIKNRMIVSINYQHKTIITVILLALMLYFGVNNYTSTENDKHQSATNQTNISKAGVIQKARLLALVKQTKTCSQVTSKDIPLTKLTFADVSVNSLCELTIQADKRIVQILLIAQDAYTVLPLIKTQNKWKIPLPKNRSSDRSYFLVAITQALPEFKIEQLRLYREAMLKPNMLTESTLVEWLENHMEDFTVYTHKLLIE